MFGAPADRRGKHQRAGHEPVVVHVGAPQRPYGKKPFSSAPLQAVEARRRRCPSPTPRTPGGCVAGPKFMILGMMSLPNPAAPSCGRPMNCRCRRAERWKLAKRLHPPEPEHGLPSTLRRRGEDSGRTASPRAGSPRERRSNQRNGIVRLVHLPPRVRRFGDGDKFCAARSPLAAIWHGERAAKLRRG